MYLKNALQNLRIVKNPNSFDPTTNDTSPSVLRIECDYVFDSYIASVLCPDDNFDIFTTNDNGHKQDDDDEDIPSTQALIPSKCIYKN